MLKSLLPLELEVIAGVVHDLVKHRGFWCTVEEVVQPQLEVGIEMLRQALLKLHVEQGEIALMLEQLRSERYGVKSV